ncbi:hypothetical protein DV736_g5429, partial [Chaetothyriales sp. CBS 134916]
MADPLSITASLLAITTAALQSTKSLYETVKRFKDRDKTLRRLQDELEQLTAILDSLTEVTNAEQSMFRLLQGPIERCSQVLQEYNEMVKDTAYNLELHLRRIDEKMTQSGIGISSTSRTSVNLEDEREVTKQCLRVCEDARSYIECLSDRESSLLEETPQDTVQGSFFEAQLQTSQVLGESRNGFAATIEHLQQRLQSLLQEDDGPEKSSVRSRLQADIDISKQCLDVCKVASEVSRQTVCKIGEVVAEGDSDQVVVTTLADLFDVKKALSKDNSAQLVGSMLPEDLRYLVDKRYSSRFGAVAGNSRSVEANNTSSPAVVEMQMSDRVPLHVNSLLPAVARYDEQIHAVVGYPYYHPAFRFCRPEDPPGPQWVRESLGSILFGDRIQTSPFELKMKSNVTCKAVCQSRPFDERAAKFVNTRIEQGYNVNLLIDGLPAAEARLDPLTNNVFYSPGFPLGRVKEDGQKVLNNHWDILIDFHESGLSGKQFRVVGVVVQPHSQAENRLDSSEGATKDGDALPAICVPEGGPELSLSESGETPVTYTYSVYWRESTTAWATRWDKYLHVTDPKIHWFSLINSTIFVVFLIAMVATILYRALRRDIARYNKLDNINLDDLTGTGVADGDDVQEDSGWKLVHADVFRPPRYSLLLSVLLGNGAQLFVMVGTTLLLALLGFLSPSNRGFLTTVALLLYTLFGFIGGYVSARAYKTLGGEKWKLNVAATPVFVPGIVFSTFFLLNLFVFGKGGSGAVPLTTMLAIIVLWFLISVPLSVAGSWLGFKHPPFEPPTRVNQIPRQIPPVTQSLRLLPSILMTGILPFCAIFVELYFILNSLWASRVYYMFGFLFVCFGLMVLTSACVTILLTYFLLCAEDYRWQWRAFIGSGMMGGYVFLNALFFWATRIKFGGLTGAVLYIGYSALMSFLVAVLSGTIGFLAAYAFCFRIYRSIKVD